MEKARIDDPALDIPAVCEHLWQIIGNLGIVRNRALIVPGTQALHHVLPDLVPWTAHGPGRSFSGQPQTAHGPGRSFSGQPHLRSADVSQAWYVDLWFDLRE